MADKWAVGNGNWSAAGTWNDGILPGVGDDVYADGKTVTIDQDVTVLSIRTTQRSGGTAGGGFTLAAGWTITADMIAGTTTCVTYASAGTAYINGDVYAGSATTARGVLVNNNSAIVEITGNVTGGSASGAAGVYNATTSLLVVSGNVASGSNTTAYGIHNNSSGTVIVVGNVVAYVARGIYNALGGTVDVSGSVTGGFASNAIGVHNAGTGNILLTGTVTGGSHSAGQGVYNSQTGTVTITGNVTAGSAGVGAYNHSTGKILISGSVTSVGSVQGVLNNSSGIISIGGDMVSSSDGYAPFVAGRWMIDDDNRQQATFATDAGGGTPDDLRTLYTDLHVGAPPDGAIVLRGGFHRGGGGLLLGAPF